MHAFKALVRNGRLILDEPTDLPEGTLLELVVGGDADQGDDLDDLERAELHAALDEGLAEMRAGGGVDSDEVLAALGARG